MGSYKELWLSLFSFCTFTEIPEAKRKRFLLTVVRSSEVTSLGWPPISLWTRHMRSFGFWFSISTGLPSGHEWIIFLLVVGLDFLKCKLSEEEMSFFFPSPAGLTRLQLRGASAKVKSLFHPFFFPVFNVELMSVQLLSGGIYLV